MTHEHSGKGYGGNPAENYERYFVPTIGRPVAEELMQIAALRQGERVLDVACGTGIATRLAAERTGATVAGLDANPGMVAVAKSAAPNGSSAEWHEASAESMPLPDEAFDVVLCQLSLQFFEDKAASLREMRRVLAPDGRLALNVPGKMPSFFEIMDEALGRHLGPEAAGFLRTVFSLHDPDEVRGLVDAAGFADVDVQVNNITFRLPAPADFLWQYLYSTPLAEAVGKLDDSALAALERDVAEPAQDLVQDGGVNVEQPIVFATARK